MSWIDIIILAMIVVGGLIGVLRGIKKSALSFAAFLVSFLLAFFLANVVAEAFLGISGVKNLVLGNGFGEGSDPSLAKLIYSAFGSKDVAIAEDSYLFKNFYAPIFKIMEGSKAVIDSTEGLSLYLAFLVLSVVCAIGIFAVSRFLLTIVTAIVKSYISKKKSILLRLFGLLMGMVRGGAWAFFVTFVFTCVGGMTFFPVFDKIEAEFEHKNAVICGYVYDGAYSMRNKLFLPDSELYGRLVDKVYKKGSGDDPTREKLDRPRLDLYIVICNANYESGHKPWSIDDNNARKCDEAELEYEYSPEEFAGLGFDAALEAIIDFNKAAAEKIDDITQFTDTERTVFEDYVGFVESNSKNLASLISDFVKNLRKYNADYAAAEALTDNDEKVVANNTTLSADYTAAVRAWEAITEQYGNTEDLFGEFEGVTLPAKKTVAVE